jgi:hypothetical protein
VKLERGEITHRLLNEKVSEDKKMESFPKEKE